MELKIKKNIKDLDLTYVNCYHFIHETNEDWNIVNKIKLVNLYTRVDVSEVIVSDINKAFNIIIEVLGKYKQKEIPLILEYDGKDYELQDDFFKLPAGWYIDSSSANFKEVPELLPAFAYIEKGMKYAETDEHSNVINPLKKRAEMFKKNMNVSQYLDLTGFFLHRQNLYNLSYTLMKSNPIKEKKKRLFNGKRLFMRCLKSIKQIGKRLLK
jgi:hypothetical protein|tara:strand:- start:653 stop:1288 length:636 start_codon:yes stop_codon:yes gene_type:complete